MNANLTGKKCITLDDGFEVKVKAKNFDDYEFLDTMKELTEGNVFAFPKIVNMLFDSEEKARILDHIRDGEGVASATGMEKIVTEVFQKLNNSNESIKK